MGFNNVRIVQNGRFSKVFIDGTAVKGLTAVEYRNDMESIPSIKLEFFVGDTEIEINDDVPDVKEAEIEEKGRTL